MLDYLSEKNKCLSAAKGAKLIETAIEVGFERNELRPMEFGGDMGTKAISGVLISLLKDKFVQKRAL
jgi:3-isopropylmalate dehydrogenase